MEKVEIMFLAIICLQILNIAINFLGVAKGLGSSFPKRMTAKENKDWLDHFTFKYTIPMPNEENHNG